MWSLLLLFVASSVYFYVQAFVRGFAVKKWAVAGLILGPFLLPLFVSHVRLMRFAGQRRGIAVFQV